MEFIEIIQNIMAAIRKLPRKMVVFLFANNRAGQYDMTFGMMQKYFYIDRVPCLTKIKSGYVLRLFAYALCLFWIYSLMLWGATSLLVGFPLLVTMAVILAVMSALGHQILCCYFPEQFAGILREAQTVLRKKETLGIQATGVICEGALVINMLLAVLFGSKEFQTILYFLDFGIFVIVYCIFCLPVLFLNKRYILFNRSKCPEVVYIHEIYDSHPVNLTYQELLEISNQKLLIYPIPEWRNPKYAKAPAEYQIPIKSISYIELGDIYITYDFEKSKWIKQVARPFVH